MNPPRPDTEDLPEALLDSGRRVSLVWLIPLVAVLAAAWLAWHTQQQRGPLVSITFQTAEGLEAGRTRVRFKDVDVGMVESISLSPDLAQVRVQVRLAADMEAYLNDKSRFWVVRPRLYGGGVSGLETLVGGTYIAADFARDGQPRYSFDGLEAPPIVSASAPGRAFTLQAESLGSLRMGSPLLYRGIEVGRVVGYALHDPAGVDVHVFIESPYDARVGEQTRFWSVSGLALSLDASGVQITASSLASVLLGGIAFGNPDGSVPGEPAAEDASFQLYADQKAAFATPSARREVWQLEFDSSVRGLVPGAPVEFRGIPVGEVIEVALELDREQAAARIPVTIAVEPGRLDIPPAEAAATPQRALWDELVANGLRAQLRTGNLVSGALYVDLDFYPEAEPQAIAWERALPVLPTVPTPLDELRTLMTRLARLPLDSMGQDLSASLAALRETMNATNALLTRLDRETASELGQTLAQTRDTLAAMERFLKPNAPLQAEAQRALREFGAAARSLRVMADYLERHPEALIRGKGSE